MRKFLGIIFLAGCLFHGSYLLGSEPDTQETELSVHEAGLDSPGESPVHGSDGRKPWLSVTAVEKAKFFHEQGDFALAEKACIEVLESNVTMEKKKEVLILLAEVYHDRGVTAKAVDTLENCLRNFPEVAKQPEFLFRLGEFYNELGLKEDSIGMFYRVLNSIVITGESNLEKYLDLARLSQFEIALNHYEQEAYDRAFMLFDRIDLLELDPADREVVSYYKSLSLLKAGENERALKLLREFVDGYPSSDLRPEMLYLTAEVLYRMNRTDASSEALLQLLKMTGIPSADQDKKWVFWRQQAGNRLANRFYGDGNYLVALRIYQGMVQLENNPSWQLPIVYQIGLCFEKLNMYDRAIETYTYIDEEIAKLDGDSLDMCLTPIIDGVEWRLDVLDWRKQMEEKLEAVVSKEPVIPVSTQSDS